MSKKNDIDIRKVITMIAVHEMEEIIIGDLTCFQTTKEAKQELGHNAVIKIFNRLSNADEIKNLIFEFDEGKTPEAQFAYFCDKLECDIQSKIYDEENCVDINHQKHNSTIQDEQVQNLLKSDMSWSEMWIAFSQKKYNYDENFLSVSNYVKNNKIL